MTPSTFRSAIPRTGCVLLALLLTASGVFSQQQGTDYKIDHGLEEVLADDAAATAPFFVVFGERANLKPAYWIADRAVRGHFVVQTLQATANRSQAGVRGFLQGRGVAYTPFWASNRIFVHAGTLELARALARRPEVAAIIPEVVYRIPQPEAASSTQSVEWNIAQIKAADVWPVTRGEGTVVANIDTGVQYNHPALVSQYRGKVGQTFVHAGNWSDPTGVCGAVPCDNNGHGTHTMGTMVGDDGGSNEVGVAPGAKWIACKGCITGTCFSSHLNWCAQWILDPNGDGSGAGRPDVVNNSWGGGSGDPWFQANVQAWVAAGIFPAFSAGNGGPGCGTVGSPGDYPESFAAGATDISDGIASFSARGPSAFGPVKPDVSAPGVSVRSSIPTNSYRSLSGTSMASPHVAGSVALLWAAAPAQRGQVADAKQLLEDTATVLTTSQTCGGLPPGAAPNNTFGWGRIDVFAAVNGGGGTVNQPPAVTITNPSNGASYACSAMADFTGKASDPEDGDLTASIKWSEGGSDFGAGGSASKSYACTEAGTHTITARIVDSSGASDTDSINITIIDSNLPTAPSDLAASVNGSAVNLTWKDNSTNESGFKVERKERGSWTALTPVTGANVTTYTDSPGKGNWQYRVRAFNAAGDSDASNVASARVR